MSRVYLAGLAFVSLMVGPQVFAAMPWDVSSIEITEVSDNAPPSILVDTDCSRTPLAGPEPDAFDIDLEKIISIGEKIWKIVEANKPVVNVKTNTVSALPRGIVCWSDLDGWKAPKTRSFEVKYKNYFDMEVVKFRFRLQFTHGGGYDGLGKYLANVTVLPAELNVIWGYKFNADVEILPAVNIGSSKNPVAGLELNLKWTIATPMKETQNSFHMFVQGDGDYRAEN